MLTACFDWYQVTAHSDEPPSFLQDRMKLIFGKDKVQRNRFPEYPEKLLVMKSENRYLHFHDPENVCQLPGCDCPEGHSYNKAIL